MKWYVKFLIDLYSRNLWISAMYYIEDEDDKRQSLIKFLKILQAYTPGIEFSFNGNIVDLSDCSTLDNLDGVILDGVKIPLDKILWLADDGDDDYEIYSFLEELYAKNDTFLKNIPQYITSEAWIKFVIKQTESLLKVSKCYSKEITNALDTIHFYYTYAEDLMNEQI